jgi:hypothetical protein
MRKIIKIVEIVSVFAGLMALIMDLVARIDLSGFCTTMAHKVGHSMNRQRFWTE